MFRLVAFAVFASIVVTVVVVGCAPSRADIIAPVASIVRQRGELAVVWRGETESDAEVEKAINALLARELTADSAVELALLRNKDLEASYESLGMSEAALVQAGLFDNPIFEGTLHVAGD